MTPQWGPLPAGPRGLQHRGASSVTVRDGGPPTTESPGSSLWRPERRGRDKGNTLTATRLTSGHPALGSRATSATTTGGHASQLANANRKTCPVRKREGQHRGPPAARQDAAGWKPATPFPQDPSTGTAGQACHLHANLFYHLQRPCPLISVQNQSGVGARGADIRTETGRWKEIALRVTSVSEVWGPTV